MGMTRMQLWNWVKVVKMRRMLVMIWTRRERGADIDTGSVRLTMLGRDCVQFAGPPFGNISIQIF